MEVFSVLKFEVKKNFKSILAFTGVIGGFVLLMNSLFDPTIFAYYNEIMNNMPPEVLDLIGGLTDLSTFEGFFTRHSCSDIHLYSA